MICLFIGRFQPFHNGHLHDIKKALEFSNKVVMGIGSSNENNTTDNPFSYEERKVMIEKVLKKNNITKVSIHPIPDIHDDEKWVEHTLSIVGKIDIVYTGNNWVNKLFKLAGYDVKDVDIYKDITSTEIRKRIHRGNDWTDLVPLEVEEVLRKIEGINRIKEINGII